VKGLLVAGARPNFMKIAPIHRAMLASGDAEPIFVHTGQHYDPSMSAVFLDELGLPQPDYAIGVGSGSHAEQTAGVLVGVERIACQVKPDVVVVVGDVNSTLAAALAAAKLDIPVAHVEAGLRSFDRAMPEEINRLLTDALSTFLFATSGEDVDNLMAEGVSAHRVFLVGNVMIDSLVDTLPRAERSTIVEDLSLTPAGYVVATLHRPSTVDRPDRLRSALGALADVGATVPVVLVSHPRSTKKIEASDLLRLFDGTRLRMLEPLGHTDFVALLRCAGAVITDSGGIQEETTYLGIPCITMRTSTERPVTISEGTNRLVGLDPKAAVRATREALSSGAVPGRPKLWDGKTAERIVRVLLDHLDAR